MAWTDKFKQLISNIFGSSKPSGNNSPLSEKDSAIQPANASGKPQRADIDLPLVPIPPNQDPLEIWVVDDEPVNLMVIQTAMLQTGYKIRLFERATEVIEAIRREQVIPHLILSDVMMPSMSGYELAEIIRTRYGHRDLPIVMISAKNRSEDIKQGLDAGANDYMTKPFVKADLIQKVRNQLQTAS